MMSNSSPQDRFASTSTAVCPILADGILSNAEAEHGFQLRPTMCADQFITPVRKICAF